MLALIIIAALLLDRIAGEPNRWHPLVGFGTCANALEQRFNQRPGDQQSIATGVFWLVALLLPIAIVIFSLKYWLAKYWFNVSVIFEVLVVYWAIGLSSLHQHIKPIQTALENADLEQAKELVARVVSRDTAQMDGSEMTSAAIETTVENGADSVFSALFWFAIGGVFMVVVYRLANTLDAMWGYRTERFEYFGKAAAKFDDALNYIPARLTALTYGLCGDLKGALKSWQHDAHLLDSPNAGAVMAAGAGFKVATIIGIAA